MIRWNLLKCVLIIPVMFHPLCIFAEKTLVVATSADPGHLNPGITTGYNVHVFADSIYSGLIMLNKDLKPEPDLAESWSISEDAKVFTFNIRKNAKWHDGKSVTSEDVKYTFENVLFKYHSRTKSGLGKKVKRFLMSHHIKVLEIQDLSKNTYTVDLLEYLFKKFPQKKFVWLMGADNLVNFHLWRDWKKIFYNIPIAIFNRPPYSLSISKAKAILYFKEDRINSKLSRNLKFMKPPKWLFLTGLTNLQSSTKIRQKKVESA